MNQILGQSKFLQYRISPILSENQSCRQLCLQPARLFHQTVPSQTHSLVHFELNLTCLIILREAVPSAWPSRTILRGSVSLASQTFRGKIHFYIFVQLKNVLFLLVKLSENAILSCITLMYKQCLAQDFQKQTVRNPFPPVTSKLWVSITWELKLTRRKFILAQIF